MKKMLYLFLVIWVTGWMLVPGLVFAQNEEHLQISLGEAEKSQLRAILDEPIPENALVSAKVDIFKRKDAAAWKLGDQVKMEEVLRQWAAVDPGARWRLRDFLALTPKRDEAYAIGLELVKDLKYPPAAVRIRTTLANNYIQDSNPKMAQQLLGEAEQIIKTEWGRMNRSGANAYWLMRAELEFNLSQAYLLRRVGKWQEGMQAAKLAVTKARELVRVETLVDVRERQFGRSWSISASTQLADQQIAAGQFAQAEMTLRDAFQWGKQLGLNDNQLMNVYGSLSWLRTATGAFDQAISQARRNEQIVLDQGLPKGSPSWIYTQIPWMNALAGADRWDEAVKRLDAMDQEVRRVQTKSSLVQQTWLRAIIYMQTGRYVGAKRLFGFTMKFHEENYGESHYFTAFTRGLYATLLMRTGELTESRQQFERAFQNINSPDTLTGDFTEDAVRLRLKRLIFQSYIELLSRTASTDSADAATIFQMADRLNASSVQQALTDAAVRSATRVPGLSDVIRDDQNAKNEMASLLSYLSGQGIEGESRRNPQVVAQMRLRMQELEVQRRANKQKIQKSFPEYFALIQPKPPSVAEIARQLKPDEVFMAAVPVAEQTFVWVIDAQGQIRFHQWQVGESKTEELVARVRKTLDVAALGTRAPAFDADASHQIYKGLMGPVEDMLKGKKHLVFSSSGALAKFPLAVLLREPATQRDAAKMAWLIKDLAVSQVPTASGWMSLKNSGQVPFSTQPLMAWGDPVFDLKLASARVPGESGIRALENLRAVQQNAGLDRLVEDSQSMYSRIPPLPETRDEVMQLAQILNSDPAKDLRLGAQATRESVLESSRSGAMQKKQIIVFATHGLLAGDLPDLNQPALAMAANPNPNDSPLLTLEDVLGLKLNADWVVLSACNTAGEDGKAHEALSGLARGFFFAGSRSLLVTHWSVESESAMLLTTKTFAAYKTQVGIRRAEAIRQAMLDVMKLDKFAHPTYWAPYALVGEGGR